MLFGLFGLPDINAAAAEARAAMELARQAVTTADAASVSAAQRVRGFSLGTISFREQAVVALALGVAAKTFDVPGAVVGEPLLMTPAVPLPIGWLLAQAVCVEKDRVTISYYRPALALGALVAFDIPLIALRK